MTDTVSFDPNPCPDDIQKLENGIMDNAKRKKGHAPIESFSFFIRDENGQVQGGCNGITLYGCLYIDQLWVDESRRNKGYGVKLVNLAEKFALDNGCSFSTVNTMDWEALDFYKKLGYQVEFERHGFDKDSIFYFLRKDFDSSP